MSLEHRPARSLPGAVIGTDGSPRRPPDASDFWDAFIDEKAAADFLGLTDRTMQGYRQKGGGPKYVALSSRCLRYTRRWLRGWAESHVRTSTADPGQGAA
jgi:hypothetical protein